ncbi:MAG: MFS transporter [Chloroflexi bacterium]|nr:MFS transporter [Chloroflexota bacterium]
MLGSLLHWRRGGGVSATGRMAADAESRNALALLVVVATNNTAWNLITPFVPLFVLELLDGDARAAAFWSGIAIGISPMMTAVVGPFWGMFAERFGSRSALMRTILCSTVLVVLLAFAVSIWQVLALRFLSGVLGGFYVLVHGLAAKTVSREKVGQLIGTLQAVSMIGLAIVPPFAGLLVDLWGLRSNFVLGAAIMVLSFVAMWLGYQNPTQARQPAQADASHGRDGTYWGFLRDRRLALLAVVVFVGQYVERTFWPLAPLLVLELAPGSEQLGLLTGLVLGSGSAATALSAIVGGRLARRYDPRALLLASLAAGSVSLPMLALAGTVWQFVGLRLLMGVLTGGTVTLAYSQATRLIPADRLSSSFSMFASVAMAASAVGPISLSPLATFFGLDAPLFAGGVAFGACFLLLLLGSRTGLMPTPRAVPASDP